jgi:hypothetical protein
MAITAAVIKTIFRFMFFPQRKEGRQWGTSHFTTSESTPPHFAFSLVFAVF